MIWLFLLIILWFIWIINIFAHFFFYVTNREHFLPPRGSKIHSPLYHSALSSPPFSTPLPFLRFFQNSFSSQLLQELRFPYYLLLYKKIDLYSKFIIVTSNHIVWIKMNNICFQYNSEIKLEKYENITQCLSGLAIQKINIIRLRIREFLALYFM